MNVTEGRPHEQNGPSSLARRRACPGSRWAEFGLPDEESEHSKEGTEAHALLERLLGGGNPVGDENREMLTAVMDVVRWVDDWRRKGYVIRFEFPVDPGKILGPMTAGTADIVMVKGEHIVVADFKYGHKDVPVRDNAQLLGYAAGTACEPAIIDWTDDRVPGPWWTLVIIQPRLYTGGTVKSYDLSYDEIQPLWDCIRVDLALCTDNAERTPSADACRFCKARLACRERFEGAQAAAGTVVAVTDEPLIEEAAMQPQPNGIEGLSPEAISSLLDLKPLLDAVFDDVQELAFQKVRSGITVPGFKIIEGPGRRKWNLTEEELARKFKSLKVPMADYLVSKMGSPAQIEGLESVKNLSDKQRANIAGFYDHTPGKEKLVTSSTSGKEVVYDSAAAFAAAAPTTPLSFL